MEQQPQTPRKGLHFGYNMKIYLDLLSDYKFHVFGLILLLLMIEATMVLDKYLFKIIVDNGTEFVANVLPKDKFTSILTKLIIFFAINLIIRFIAKWFNMHIINRLDANLIMDLKRKFFNHLVELSHNFHTSNKSGAIISKLMRGSNSIVELTDVFVFNFIPLIFQLVIIAGSLLYLDITSSIIIVLVCVAFTGYSIIINYLQQESNMLANDAEDDEKATISDIFTNIETIKYFGKETAVKRKFAKVAEYVRYSLLKHWDYFRFLDSGQSLILGVGTFLLLYFPLKGMIAGTLTLGTMVFIYTAYTTLMESLFGFVQGIRNLYWSMAGFESLFQYLKIKNEIVDEPNAKKLHVTKGAIQFKEVSFGYRKKPILFNFNLDIKPNLNVAIVGPSGAGKSTIIRLLYRLYDLDAGEILIDGQDIKKYKQESLRAELSIVPQECILFDDTIYNNILFSNPKATKEQVFNAMRFAQLDKIVNNFPDKERTIVGERGLKLSGGEKQRVSIARALLADRKILVLDEATSALDSGTEREIQKTLEQLMVGRTTIIIAHRLSTIMMADMIVVMDKGQIAELGKHEELIKKDGLYKKLWNLQKGGYIR